MIPKDQNLIIFSLNFNRYTDNSKALYEYLSKHEARLDVFWLGSRVVEKNVLGKFGSYPSIRGLWLALRAKVYVMTYSSSDLKMGNYFSSKKIKIQLWHAITLKMYGVPDKKFTPKMKLRYTKYETSKYTAFVAASKLDALSVAACNHLPNEKIWTTGLPRNDRLFHPLEPNNINGLSSKIASTLTKKVILYAPTFRDFGVTKFFPFEDFSPHLLADFLEKNDTYLFIRPHQNDFENQEKTKILTKSYGDRFVLADNSQVADIADILPYVNTVITDYSSIYIDLLLLDCPCVFIPYDLEKYEQERGILYDYHLVTPGPKVSNTRDFIKSLEDGIRGGKTYKEERLRVKNLFHTYQDDKSCERVTQHLIQLLSGDRS